MCVILAFPIHVLISYTALNRHSHPSTLYPFSLPPFSPLHLHLLFLPFSPSNQQVQLQAWNAIDTATPIEMVGKTALNLLWFTVLARTLSTIFKQYVQASREFLLRLKEKQMTGNYHQNEVR